MANDENRDSKDKEIERQTAIMVKLAEDLRRKETETARLQAEAAALAKRVRDVERARKK